MSGVGKFGSGYGSFGDAGGYAGTPDGYAKGGAPEPGQGPVQSGAYRGQTYGQPAPAPGYGQTLAPMANTNTGYQNAAQPGPGMMPSPQWQAATQAVPAPPNVPGVQWQHGTHPPPQPFQPPMMTYGGPGHAPQVPQYAAHPQYASQQYAGPQFGYVDPRTMIYTWQGNGGWVYRLYADDNILANGTYNGQVFTNKPNPPGSESHKAIVREWLQLHPNHANDMTLRGIGQKFLAMKAAAEPGLLSTVTGAVRDAVSTVTGGFVAPSTPQAPPSTAVPGVPSAPPMQYAPAPYDPMSPAMMPPPPSSPSSRGAMIAGGVLVALGLGLGAWWAFGGSSGKKMNADGSTEGGAA